MAFVWNPWYFMIHIIVQLLLISLVICEICFVNQIHPSELFVFIFEKKYGKHLLLLTLNLWHNLFIYLWVSKIFYIFQMIEIALPMFYRIVCWIVKSGKVLSIKWMKLAKFFSVPAFTYYAFISFFGYSLGAESLG